MLIDFQVENFRSYRAARTFSMVASAVTEHPENCMDVANLPSRLLRSAVIYGANASGKSNLLLAAHFLADFIRRGEVARVPEAANDPPPFVLDQETAKQPSRFTVNFLCNGVRHEYFLAVRPGRVEEEWLNVYPVGRRQEWFHRRAHGKKGVPQFTFNGTSLKGQKKRLAEVTRPDVPFLSVAAAFNHEQLAVPARWLADNFRNHLSPPRDTAERCHRDPGFLSWAAEFIRQADLGILKITVELVEREGKPAAPAQRPEYKPYFLHKGKDGGFSVQFGLRDESEGTKQLFRLLAPWYELLQEGRVAFVDELGASMHPLMTRRLIGLFHDPTVNTKGAQLVLTTHDTSLLSAAVFRRDQVWFTEKDRTGSTDLYSLHDFHPRVGDALEKGYLNGRYGAIPFFGELDFTWRSEKNKRGS